MFLEDIFSDLNIPVEPGLDAEITLFRESDKFVFSMVNLLGEQSGQFRLFPNDKIYIKPLNYRQAIHLYNRRNRSPNILFKFHSEAVTITDDFFWKCFK